MGKAKFVTKKTKTGNAWFFVLKAGNGETLLTSEGYQTRQGANKGSEAIKAAVAQIVADEFEAKELPTTETFPSGV